MSKNIVSGAIALLMVLVPVSAAALTPTYIPTIPQNPTIQQLQQLVVELSAILQQLLLLRTSPQPTPPLTCPIYNAPLCETGSHMVGGDYQSNGCQGAPRCQADDTSVSSISVSFSGISGATYRIGEPASFQVNYYNAPSDSNICLVIASETRTWEGGFQGFGGSDGCYYASGNGSRTFSAVLGPKAGFDFTEGRYHLSAKLIKSATGTFQPYATAVSQSFSVESAGGVVPTTITLTGPSNGATYKVGDTIPVTWNFTGAPPNSQVLVKTENIAASNPSSGNVSSGGWQGTQLYAVSGSGTYNWQTGPSMTDFTGTYRISAMIRECDPRGCQWNADFPGQQTNVKTYAYAANPIIITLNGTQSASNPRITLGTISSSYVYVNYYDLPAHTQLGLMNQSTGARVEMPLQVVDYGGTGTWSIPISSNLPSGSYYVRAQNYATGTYISQTVPFTAGTASNPTPSCTISVSPASVTQGQSVTISWTTVNASSATFNGGSVQTNGSQTMTWLAGPGTFNMPLVVTGTGGTATCNAVVNATALTGTLTADIKANNSNGPVSVTSGQNATISWTSTGASMCSIIPSAQTYWAGNFGLTGSKESGALTQTNTYTLTCYGNGNAFVTDTVTVTVAPVVIACPMYAALICPTGQHVVSSPTTKDANNCDVPHNSCVPDQVSCTYTPGSSKYGDKYAPPTASNPSTINIEGGQAACASWCSSQGAERGVQYSCTYNGQKIAIIKRENEKQLASALSAIENAIKSIIAFFRPAPVPDSTNPSPAPSSGSASGAENWGPTSATQAPAGASAPTPVAVQSSGTLKAVFKGIAFPEIPNVTRELAQKLCRADAVCTWNNESITAVTSFGQPGDPTMAFTLPAAGSKQTLASGAGYTFEITDPTLPKGPVAANTYRLYFAKYTSKNGPDAIYQGQITSVSRTLSGAVQIKWEGRVLRADGITEPLPPGFYYPAAVNGTNALKGGSTGSITITP